MLKRIAIVLATALAFGPGAALAQISDGVIKIGVLNDQSSLYADLAGQGSVVAARMAVEDFASTNFTPTASPISLKAVLASSLAAWRAFSRCWVALIMSWVEARSFFVVTSVASRSSIFFF